MNRARTHTRRRALVALVAALTAGSTLVTYAAASSPNQGNRMTATFTTSVQVLNNQLAAFGIVQAIATGSGTVEGFGAAHLTAGVTQDRTVTTCGPGSAVAQVHYRIVTDDGTLILRASAARCLDATGVAHDQGTYVVDGAASSGVFAGAKGDGDFETVIGATSNTATFTGQLKVGA